ncbi:MAG: cell division protein ZapB [Spirochaetaceae bacterium]|jgi:FtsZ-binding cell division protein ZapB|nr:cell division protein ZapB [Spirochaetaceae bacterium]
MVNIEQVRLLESRVTKAIDYVNKLTEENTLLKSKEEDARKRIEELEVIIRRFKEDQAHVEEGIVSMLQHLNRFEDVKGVPFAAGAPAAGVAPQPEAAAAAPETRAPVAAESPQPTAGAGDAAAQGAASNEDADGSFFQSSPSIEPLSAAGGGPPEIQPEIF